MGYKKTKFDFLSIYSALSLALSLYFLYLSSRNLISMMSLNENSLFEGFEGMPRGWVISGILIALIFVIYSGYYLWKRYKISTKLTIILSSVLILLGIIQLFNVDNTFLYYLFLILDERLKYLLIIWGVIPIFYHLLIKNKTSNTY